MNDTVFLRLLQLFDSQFPIGHFAHSGGIETYASLDIKPNQLQELLENEIQFGWGRLDVSAVALAWADAFDSKKLDELGYELDAWKTVEITRQMSITLGERTLILARRLFPEFMHDVHVQRPHQAIVVGVVGKRANLPLRTLLLAFVNSQATASVRAAVRCMPLSPERAEEILVALQPNLGRAVNLALENAEDGLFTNTPTLDIRRQQQTSLATRLFRS